MSPQTREGDGGFVLVEAIAVLALSGLVLLTLLIASGLVARNSAAVANRANEMESLNTGLATFERDLAGAQPLASAGADSPILFEAGPSSVGFVAPADVGGGQQLVRIEAKPMGGQGALVRSSAPLQPQTGGFAGAGLGHPVVLLSGPWTYRLSYGKAGDGPIAWTDGWSDTKQLPDAVQLEILDAGGARTVSPQIVALHIQSQGRCDPSADPNCKAPPGANQEGDKQPKDSGNGDPNDGSTR